MLVLDRTTVLDLSLSGPGAFCTAILADFGAQVIMIEPVEGRWAQPRSDRRRLAFDSCNRNKKSMRLNLKSEAGQQIFYRLSEKSDVIVEGFRPGVASKLGIGYETIGKLNRRIIFCSLSGYGQNGPRSGLPGHDINYIAAGGALGMFRGKNGPPVAPLNLVGDLAGGSLYSAIGILLALMARSRTGRGQYVDIAYTDGVVALMEAYAQRYFNDGTIPEPGETLLHGAYPYYRAYETSDGKYISIGCIEPWFWERLCQALGVEEYIPYCIKPEHFYSGSDERRWQEISQHLERIFLARTRDEWFELLSGKDIPVAKVNDLAEVFSDPQVVHRNMVVEVRQPDLGRIRQVGTAIKLSRTPGGIRSLAPLSGEHTHALLAQFGYTQEQIREFRESKVVG